MPKESTLLIQKIYHDIKTNPEEFVKNNHQNWLKVKYSYEREWAEWLYLAKEGFKAIIQDSPEVTLDTKNGHLIVAGPEGCSKKIEEPLRRRLTVAFGQYHLRNKDELSDFI